LLASSEINSSIRRKQLELKDNVYINKYAVDHQVLLLGLLL